MLRVMVVDEDNERRQVLRQGLERAGHYVVAEVQSTINLWVLHQFHCDFSLSDGEFGFSTLPT